MKRIIRIRNWTKTAKDRQVFNSIRNEAAGKTVTVSQPQQTGSTLQIFVKDSEQAIFLLRSEVPTHYGRYREALCPGLLRPDGNSRKSGMIARLQGLCLYHQSLLKWNRG